MFASDHSGVEPDIMTLAKTLSGGLIPIGAFVTRSEIWDEAFGTLDTYNSHTSTFGGNNLAAAAGLAAIEAIREEGLAENAAALGGHFLEQLSELRRKHRVIRDVRGIGLMIGIEFTDFLAGIVESPAARELLSYLGRDAAKRLAGMSASIVATVFIMAELLNTYGLITHFTLHRGLTLRVQPPLTVNRDQIDYFLESLDKLCVRLSVVAGMCDELDSASWSR
jgi:putrescine aminotransferase